MGSVLEASTTRSSKVVEAGLAEVVVEIVVGVAQASIPGLLRSRNETRK